MAKSEKPIKTKYKVLRGFSTHKEEFKPGDTIYLTKEGYEFLKPKKIVE